MVSGPSPRREEGGNKTFCILKYFFTRLPIFLTVFDNEYDVNKLNMKKIKKI